MDSLNLCRNGLQAGTAANRLGRTIAVAMVLVWFAGCSAVPDELNPVEWANDVDAYLSGEEVQTDPELAERIAAERAQPVPGSDQDFPKLSSVPGQAPTVTSLDERAEIADRLERDRAETRYIEAAAGTSAVPTPIVTSEPVIISPNLDRRETAPEPAETAAAEVLAVPTVPTPPLQSVTPQATARFTEAEMAEFAWAGNLDGLVHAAAIYYASGSSRLSRADKKVLQQVAEAQKLDGAIVRVVGHASLGGVSGDPVKAKIANFEIAYDRARKVADELIRLGIPADRVFVASASDSQPAYSETTLNGARANRRTDIYFEYDRSPA
jgi:outer membrane protein OmpA-like peptidoglycan-associated protein